MSSFYNIKNSKVTPVAKDGVIIVPNPNILNFTGAGVNVSGDLNGNANVNITGGSGGSSLLEFNTLAQLDAYKVTSNISFIFLVSSIGYIGIYSITAGEFAIAGNR